ncbi:uncharacterized protein LOC113359634 [Papaver somniferum]|uniref:uncharacterized protein LOC113359634 n=1 Tax=Papaver somniferum TaxID=3469 RepID=UPI000E70393C|nr:uncharacterized protein LOC113359634 [Papaver somniferum]
MIKNGYDMVSRCCISEKSQDNMNHLLWEYKFSIEVWNWACSVFNFTKPKYFEDVWRCARNKVLWLKNAGSLQPVQLSRSFGFGNNKKIFEQVRPNIQNFKCRIKKTVCEGGLRMKGNKWDQAYDNQIILFFNLGPRMIRFQNIKTCYWIPPKDGFILFCCDGASFGNPGAAGFGIVIRDHLFQVLGTLSGGIGVASNYITEVYVVICAAELAVTWDLKNIIINSYSKTLITEFAENKMPWFVRIRWHKAVKKLNSITFCHCFREVNFSADTAAKRGAKLAAGERQLHYGRPNFLTRIEMPNIEYYRFC